FIAYSGYQGVVNVIHAEEAPDRSTLGGPSVRLRSDANAPDIIHLIFDGLGRLDVLQETYGLNAGGIRRKLRSDGVQLNDAAVANYSKTFLAVSSVLSMEYLDSALPLAANPHDRTLTETVIAQASVIRALKARGYRFTLLSSGYDALA